MTDNMCRYNGRIKCGHQKKKINSKDHLCYPIWSLVAISHGY